LKRIIIIPIFSIKSFHLKAVKIVVINEVLSNWFLVYYKAVIDWLCEALRRDTLNRVLSFLLSSFSTPTRDPQFAIVEILIPILSINYRDPCPFSELVAAGRARVSGILVRWLTPLNRISIWNNFSFVPLSFRSLTPKRIFTSLVVQWYELSLTT